LIFGNCNHPLEEPGLNSSENKKQTEYIKYQLAETVSVGLAKAMKSKEIRDFIKLKSLEAFDGDFNFLFIQYHDFPLAIEKNGVLTHTTFGEYIFNQSESASFGLYDDFVEAVNYDFPLLQIAVHNRLGESPEMWDTKQLIPPVLYEAPRYEAPDKTVRACDVNGNKYKLDLALEGPDIEVAIFENERTLLVPKTEMHDGALRVECGVSYFENDIYDLVLFTEMNDCTFGGGGGYGGGSGSGGTPGSGPCDRDRKSDKYDYLHQMKFIDRSAFKRANNDDNGWFGFDYKLEFKVVAVFGITTTNTTSVTKIFNQRDGKFKQCNFLGMGCKWMWRAVNVRTERWRPEYGKVMMYQYYEMDGGATYTQTLSFSNSFKDDDGNTSTVTSSASVTVQADDDDLGSHLLEYCDETDGEGSYYTTGTLEIKVNQQ
jgi:hypothetical protein